MKRLFALFLLISHMNTSMFLPQVPQHDVFDEYGNQIDDINSIVEYVMVSLGLDDVADDEDADNGQNFNIVNPPCVVPPFSEEITKPTPRKKITKYTMMGQENIVFMAYDIIIPPPKTV